MAAPTTLILSECNVISESEQGVVSFVADKGLAPGEPKWANYIKVRAPAGLGVIRVKPAIDPPKGRRRDDDPHQSLRMHSLNSLIRRPTRTAMQCNNRAWWRSTCGTCPRASTSASRPPSPPPCPSDRCVRFAL